MEMNKTVPQATRNSLGSMLKGQVVMKEGEDIERLREKVRSAISDSYKTSDGKNGLGMCGPYCHLSHFTHNTDNGEVGGVAVYEKEGEKLVRRWSLDLDGENVTLAPATIAQTVIVDTGKAPKEGKEDKKDNKESGKGNKSNGGGKANVAAQEEYTPASMMEYDDED